VVGSGTSISAPRFDPEVEKEESEPALLFVVPTGSEPGATAD
jgi:hypothetical protein